MISDKKEPREYQYYSGDRLIADTPVMIEKLYYTSAQAKLEILRSTQSQYESTLTETIAERDKARAEIKNLNEILSEYRGMATTGIWIEDQKYVATVAALLRATSGLERILLEVGNLLASKIALETLEDVLKIRGNLGGAQERT